MNDADKKLLVELQDFLMDHVIRDATAAAHHKEAESLFARLHVRCHQQRGQYARHFDTWRASSENTTKGGDPLVEVMVYCGLYPGRVHRLLTELLT